MKRQQSWFIVLLILILFFVISFITNYWDALYPALVDSFAISPAIASFFPFAFFAAYGLISIPAGLMLEIHGEQKVLLAAFILASLGALLFACYQQFALAMLSLFLMGSGLALLQVVINPLLRAAGGPSHFAFYATASQLIFASGAVLGPLAFRSLLPNLNEAEPSLTLHIASLFTPTDKTWAAMFWVFAAASLFFLAVLRAIQIPAVELKQRERPNAWQIHAALFRHKVVAIYFLAIVAYVATEQGIANTMFDFLQQYHQVNSEAIGEAILKLFWVLMIIGSLLGMALLKFADSRKVLGVFTALSITTLALALFGSKRVALFCLPLTGFFLSVMWPILFSLALNSIYRYHGAFSGILCTGVVGGAIAAPLIDMIAKSSGSLRLGFSFVFLMLCYILFISFWAKPLVRNSTFFSASRGSIQQL